MTSITSPAMENSAPTLKDIRARDADIREDFVPFIVRIIGDPRFHVSQSDLCALDRRELLKQHDALVAALEKAIEVIKVWHACDDVWDIYLNNAPELKPVVAALRAARGDV